MDKTEKLPTNKQLELYELIHPDFGDMTIAEAAKQLNINVSAAYRRVKRLKERCPEAFDFKRFIKEYEGVARNIEYVYKGYRSKAAISGLEFTISLDDFINIVQLECHSCGLMPVRANKDHKRIAYYDKTGYKFYYNHLWRYDVTKGYTYINCVSMCFKCIARRRDNK